MVTSSTGQHRYQSPRMSVATTCAQPDHENREEAISDNPQAGSPVLTASGTTCSQGDILRHADAADKMEAGGNKSSSSSQVNVKRLGIQRTPPALVIEYTDSHDIEEKPRNWYVGVDDRMVNFGIGDLTRALRKHRLHERYVKSVRKEQLRELLARLKARMSEQSFSRCQENLVGDRETRSVAHGSPPESKMMMADSPDADNECSPPSEAIESPTAMSQASGENHSLHADVRCCLLPCATDSPSEVNHAQIVEVQRDLHYGLDAEPASSPSTAKPSASPIEQADVQCSSDAEPLSTPSTSKPSSVRASPVQSPDRRSTSPQKKPPRHSLSTEAPLQSPDTSPQKKTRRLSLSTESASEHSPAPGASKGLVQAPYRLSWESRDSLDVSIKLGARRFLPNAEVQAHGDGQKRSSSAPTAYRKCQAPPVSARVCRFSAPPPKASCAQEVKSSTEGASDELAAKLDKAKEKIKASEDGAQSRASDVAELDTAQKGEDWLEYLARCTRRIEAAGINSEAGALFEAFRTSDDLGLIFATFAKLFEVATSPGDNRGRRGSGLFPSPPWARPGETPGRLWTYPYEAIRLAAGGWKAKSLWQVFDKRCSREEYEGGPCAIGNGAQRAVVVGAGPCGLRAAIELRLLGASVTVVERRTQFARINQLHVWSWVGEDLISLGARILEPPPRDFGSNPDLLHVCISDVQMLLLKVALLLGVEVLFGVDFVQAHWAGDSWSAVLGPSFSAGGGGSEGRAGPSGPSSCVPSAEIDSPSTRAPAVLDGMTVLMGANGFGSTIGKEAGICRLGADSKNATAIGIICNLARTNGKAERKLRSFSMARQFYVDLFRRLQETTGAELENIVYVKSSHSHYFVMTPTPGCLIRTGVVIDGACKQLLAKSNVDQDCLNLFVQRVTSFAFKKGEPAVRQAILSDLGETDSPLEYADAGPRLFDFSSTSRAADGLVFAHPPTDDTREHDDSQEANALLIALVGDALIEPFWPEGLGLIRGFFGVLDASSAVALWSSGASPGETRAYHEQAYRQLKSLAAATRKRLLHDNESAYTYLPNSRYRQLGP